jgi:replicative DNA helicase
MYNFDKELELYSQEIEELLLCGLIRNNEYYDFIDFLKPEHFYFEQTEIIFDFISKKIKNNEKVNYILLKDFFECEIEKTFQDDYTVQDYVKMEENSKKKEKGLVYLNRICYKEVIIFVEEIKDYALKIRDFYKKRHLKEFLESSLIEVAKSKTSEHIIKDLNLNIDLLEDKTDNKYSIEPIQKIAKEKIEEIKDCLSKTDKTNENILKTGFLDFDGKFGGLDKKELVILAGRPSMGKSSLSLQIALNVASNGNNVIMFSVEMSKNQITNKAISNKSKVNSQKINRNKIFSEQLGKIKENFNKIPKTFYINDDSCLTCNMIEKNLKRFTRINKKIDLIVVDYLQLLSPNESKNKNFNLVQQIGLMTKQLKSIAKKFNCVVLLLSQLSRALEDRPNKRPVLRDLRDSGKIEEDADIVLFCYREYYYKERKLPVYEERRDKKIMTEEEFNRYKSGLDYIKYDFELIMAKNRNDGIGTVKLHFKPEYSQFTDIYGVNYYRK